MPLDENGNVVVKLLPALPDEPAWQSGHVKGIAIKGGWLIDFEWKDGKIISKKLHSLKNAKPEENVSLKQSEEPGEELPMELPTEL